MTAPPLEQARLSAQLRGRSLGTAREREFDDLIRLAAAATDSPMAMLSFLDRDRLWLKAAYGLSQDWLPREHSFCEATIAAGQGFAVYDAASDPRFSRYVLVSGPTRVRAYAGTPLRDDEGTFGALAVLDTKPRRLSREQLDRLEIVAGQVRALLELRRLRDARLLKSEALLSSATRVSGIGCWQWDLARGEVSWSNEMFDIFGLPRDTRPTLEAFRDCVHPDDRELVAERTALAIEGAMTEFPDYRVLRPNGEVRVVHSTSELERDDDGRPTLLTGVIHDVTDQRRAEEERKRFTMQLMHTQKLESLGVLSAGVAHDFNNLLVGILGNAELASADTSLSPHTRSLLARVTESASQAARLTRQLLAYTGRGHIELRRLDLSAHTAATVERARVSLPPLVKLSANLPKQVLALTADDEQLTQVTLNLIINAAESYQGRAGDVRVSAYRASIESEQTHDVITPTALVRGRYVVLEVSDDGDGMSSATLERIFEPFFSTKFTGRGLGLAAVVGIAGSHRAVLTVDSRVGRGSRFRVYFPALEQATSAHAAPAPEAGSSHALSGRTVLIVDDEARVRLLERRVLEEVGARILEAENGDRALEIMQQNPGRVHLVLLDLVMPGLDSASTLHALRALQPDLPIVIQSGYPEYEVLRRMQEAFGKVDFLQKPFSPNTLLAKLTPLLLA